MNNSTFAALVVAGAVIGGTIGYKMVGALPDRFTAFGRTFVRKNKG